VFVAGLWPSYYPYGQAPKVQPQHQAENGVGGNNSTNHGPAAQVNPSSEQRRERSSEHVAEITILGVKPGEWLLSIATLMLWAATVGLVRGADRTAERQLRPYVHASNAQFIWDDIGARVIVECSNSGETPATYFELGAVSRALWRGPADCVIIPTDLTYRRWSALGGGNTKTIGVRGAASDDGADPFGEDARVVLEARGEMNFFILGRLRYGDVFGNEYETEFAFFTPNTRPNSTNSDGVKMLNPPGKFVAFRLTKRGQTT
jgi:hypothetical protein